MPIKPSLAGFLAFGFVNVGGLRAALRETLAAALGVYPTGHLGWSAAWEERVYADDAAGMMSSPMLSRSRAVATANRYNKRLDADRADRPRRRQRRPRLPPGKWTRRA